MLCDLHTHSNCSDGSLSPEELIKEAEKAGLSAVALCDHNTVSGLSRFVKAAEKSTVTAVPGVEITAVYKGYEVHILGLFIKEKYYNTITEYLQTFVERKIESSRLLAQRLVQGGFDIEYDKILKSARGAVPNRIYFAKELIKKGYVSSINEAFATILSEKGGFYESAERLDALQVIEFLTSVGAVSVFAHPFLSLPKDMICEFLPKAKKSGLIGMETIYPKFSEEETALAEKLAKEYGLLRSGGSDFHGSNKPDIKIGVGKDNIEVPYEIYEKLKNNICRL